jgi:ribonuclease P protein component
MFSLPKTERLRGKTTVSALMTKGRWGFTSDLKYCYLRHRSLRSGEDVEVPNRILVSVPKRLFKHAVKRNLLKRRLREAYRTRKALLKPSGTDILFLYNSKEIRDYSALRGQIEHILTSISDEGQS